jgi:hypothetical protein
VYLNYLALRLWKSVVTLAVTEITNCGKVFLRRKMTVFERHRLLLTGSRWDIRWLIGRRTKPTFSVFSVFGAAVKEKCCDACGDRKHYFRSGFMATENANNSEASAAVDRKSMEHTVGDRSSNKPDFLCNSCIKQGGYGNVFRRLR